MYMTKGSMAFISEGSTGKIACDYSGSASYSDYIYFNNQSCVAPACQNPYSIKKLNMTFYVRVLTRHIDSACKASSFLGVDSIN